MSNVKVMIVDDEQLSRNGLIDLIGWEKFGCTVVASAENGREALNLLTQTEPDMIITDICMPFVDGLELIEQARKLYPDITIVIISAYSEFEYAQRAIRYGVRSYILKPVMLDSAVPMLSKLAKEIARKNKNIQKISAINKIILHDGEEGADQLYSQYAQLIDKAKQYIGEHLSDSELSLDHVAAHINMSRNYFCTVFGKITGVSFSNYLTNCRILKAIELLSTTDLKIYQISDAVGYKNQTWFSTAFKRVTGKSPKDFQQYERDC
jgi:two-component system response regulator YesN